MSSDPYVKALYSPETGMIACPLLQAAVGGSTTLPHAFDTADWMVFPDDTLVGMSERMTIWEGLALLSRAERVALAEERMVRMGIEAREGMRA